ncbi:MAG: hypothetical protein HQ564_05065 [Candidatus Saganbacteria bacterium]|nr:hypothetical protein [Candidatus Saganbacteria bacterium]
MGNGIEGLKFRASTQKAKVVSNAGSGASGFVFGCKLEAKYRTPPKQKVLDCKFQKGPSSGFEAGKSRDVLIVPKRDYRGYSFYTQTVVVKGNTNYLSSNASPADNGMVKLTLSHPARPFCPASKTNLSNSQKAVYPVYVLAKKDGKTNVICRTDTTVKWNSDEIPKEIKGCIKKAEEPRYSGTAKVGPGLKRKRKPRVAAVDSRRNQRQIAKVGCKLKDNDSGVVRCMVSGLKLTMQSKVTLSIVSGEGLGILRQPFNVNPDDNCFQLRLDLYNAQKGKEYKLLISIDGGPTVTTKITVPAIEEEGQGVPTRKAPVPAPKSDYDDLRKHIQL